MISMVILPGRKRVDDETIRQHCDACGIKFIKLQHENGFGGGPIPVNGFQHIEISVTENKGRKIFQQRPSKDVDNNDCNGNRSLVFEPDTVTGELIAWLPDTVFNRNKLAHCYHHGAQWKIIDLKIDEDIQKMADEIEKTFTPMVSDEDVIVDMAGQISDKDKEIADLKAQLIIQKRTDSVVANKIERDDRKEWKKHGISQTKYLNLKASAREEVYKENEEVMAKLKIESPKGWFGSNEYAQTILPIVKQRLKDKLNALNVAGSNTANK